MTNKNAIQVLEDYGFDYTVETIRVLVMNGFIEADPIPEISEPEQMALDAKTWLGKYGSNHDAFSKASGWSTESWQIVIRDVRKDDKPRFGDPGDIRNIFAALVILAREAGIEL